MNNELLEKIIDNLKGSWEIKDFSLVGMGWAAKISNGTDLFTLHSERGWIDIYIGNYSDQNKAGSSKSFEEVAKVINGKTA